LEVQLHIYRLARSVKEFEKLGCSCSPTGNTKVL